MKIYTKKCPQCQTIFDTERKQKVFCKKPCYYKHNSKKLNEAYKEKRKMLKENPTYPKYIHNGIEYQLDFDPLKEPNRLDRFKETLKD